MAKDTKPLVLVLVKGGVATVLGEFANTNSVVEVRDLDVIESPGALLFTGEEIAAADHRLRSTVEKAGLIFQAGTLDDAALNAAVLAFANSIRAHDKQPLFATIEDAFQNEMAGEKERVCSAFQAGLLAADKVRCVHVVAPVDAEA